MHRFCKNWIIMSLFISMSNSCGRFWIRNPDGSYKRPSKKWYKMLSCLACRREGRSLTVQFDCVKGRLVHETDYGDMHYKDILGSIASVGYCFSILNDLAVDGTLNTTNQPTNQPDFYLMLHGLQ